MTEILRVKNLTKKFVLKTGEITILENISFTIMAGEKVAIIGPSGSGKSTLLSLIGLLDVPSSGSLYLAGQDTAALSEVAQAKLRNEKIGFIFQSFELIAPFTVAENIRAPLEIGGAVVTPEKINDLLEKLGLTERKEELPLTLSGGEKQRVAIARALVRTPALLLADEPTGSLDRATGERVLSLLLAAVESVDTTLIVITHDETIATRMDRVFEIKDTGIHER